MSSGELECHAILDEVPCVSCSDHAMTFLSGHTHDCPDPCVACPEDPTCNDWCADCFDNDNADADADPDPPQEPVCQEHRCCPCCGRLKTEEELEAERRGGKPSVICPGDEAGPPQQHSNSGNQDGNGDGSNGSSNGGKNNGSRRHSAGAHRLRLRHRHRSYHHHHHHHNHNHSAAANTVGANNGGDE